jgi:hypothetical protein
MQPTAGIREHAQAIEFFARRIFGRVKTVIGIPESLSIGLNFSGVVRGRTQCGISGSSKQTG